MSTPDTPVKPETTEPPVTPPPLEPEPPPIVVHDLEHAEDEGQGTGAQKRGQ